jgi:aconitate hydratase
MGILPLEFMPGENAGTLELCGNELLGLSGLNQLRPGGICSVKINRENGSTDYFEAKIRIETKAELTSFLAGGILHEAVFQ